MSPKGTPSPGMESLFPIFDLGKYLPMSRISKALEALGLIFRNPWLLNKVLEEDRIWKKKVIKQFGFSSGLPVIMPGEIFGEFTETVDPFAFLDGGSLPTDLALLKKLARRIPNCSYFEIGTWRGESVANVAAVAETCMTLSLSEVEMKELGMNQSYINMHRFFSRNISNIVHLEGNSLTYDFQLLKQKFDLIFIDGDHRSEMVKNDTEKVFRHLVHENTVVVWHDYARNPETVRFEVLAGILEGCPPSMHKNIFHIAHTLCAVFLPGQTGGKRLVVPVEPSGSFQVDIRFFEGTPAQGLESRSGVLPSD